MDLLLLCVNRFAPYPRQLLVCSFSGLSTYREYLSTACGKNLVKRYADCDHRLTRSSSLLKILQAYHSIIFPCDLTYGSLARLRML